MTFLIRMIVCLYTSLFSKLVTVSTYKGHFIDFTHLGGIKQESFLFAHMSFDYKVNQFWPKKMLNTIILRGIFFCQSIFCQRHLVEEGRQSFLENLSFICYFSNIYKNRVFFFMLNGGFKIKIKCLFYLKWTI